MVAKPMPLLHLASAISAKQDSPDVSLTSSIWRTWKLAEPKIYRGMHRVVLPKRFPRAKRGWNSFTNLIFSTLGTRVSWEMYVPMPLTLDYNRQSFDPLYVAPNSVLFEMGGESKWEKLDLKHFQSKARLLCLTWVSVALSPLALTFSMMRWLSLQRPILYNCTCFSLQGHCWDFLTRGHSRLRVLKIIELRFCWEILFGDPDSFLQCLAFSAQGMVQGCWHNHPMLLLGVPLWWDLGPTLGPQTREVHRINSPVLESFEPVL